MKFRVIALATVFVLRGFIGSWAQIRVPRGASILVDGKIETGEWKDALTRDMIGGGKVFLKHDGTSLLIGVRGNDKGWAQIYLAGDSPHTDIIVHHASAALGRIAYRLDGELWQPLAKFRWELRDRGFTPEIEGKLNGYWSVHNWAANNMNMNNPNEAEFRIKANDLNPTVPYNLAVEFVTGDVNQYFPETLADATVRSRLAQGGYETRDLRFDIKQWAKMVLEK